MFRALLLLSNVKMVHNIPCNIIHGITIVCLTHYLFKCLSGKITS